MQSKRRTIERRTGNEFFIVLPAFDTYLIDSSTLFVKKLEYPLMISLAKTKVW